MSALDDLVDRSNWQIGTVVIIGGDNRYSAEYIGDDPSLSEAAEELAALRERVEALEASNARLFDDLHRQIHQTVGAEMERDELREQVADVNELLWEFAENPNIELGEKGQSKIEDYFKKYNEEE